MTCGSTAIKAAQSHAPQDLSGKERYIFIGMPHIAISQDGEIGEVSRKGRCTKSHACGALIAFKNELEKNRERLELGWGLELDFYDLEYSIMKERLFKRVKQLQTWKDEKNPSLVEITKEAEYQIFSDLDILVKRTIDKKKSNFAVISAIQIHAPDDETYVWPHLADDYVVIDGEETVLNV